MKKIIFPLIAVFIVTLSAFTLKTAQNWKIADGYSIKFTSDDPSGIFSDLKGTITFDEKNLSASKFDVTIDVNSINTGNGMQNNHAKSAQWFDAEKYPLIKFTSKTISKTSSGYEAQGILEMHGVQKEFTLPFSIEKSGNGLVFKSTFDANRNDWKIGEPGKKASDIMKMEISVPVTAS
ncbi:MAG: YceI family protein [Fimbriimonadaceae bacterium]|nr:YceI family protein [Chitinophagales bacterium]